MAEADHIPGSKPCKACGIEKALTVENWTPQKAGKYGFTSRCRDCKKAENAALRSRPDQAARQQAWRDANKDYTKRYNEAYRGAGYSSTADVARWRKENIDHARAQEAKRNRDRRKADPCFLMKGRISARLWSMLQGKAGRSTEELLGYTMQELRAHIERQFTKGMSWEAVARGEVEIDHIIPVSSFRIGSIDDPSLRACWGLANLRPMWKRDNRAKGAKVLTLL